ncbi:Pre-rRNA-processing protein PNO1 [Gracilariopsis chorda]|uniref:Pre-rRNA-processing protein PNO1 n=1 Tax=Gracilariopsis chorda TaxID=448386 RepID=A0A2V3J4K4_9FLOR|nr:Pre-rRNA-processing protein PNO1 [Gracilariopsis chorda]|eukprot:PXF49386.1 Pre-rRNA-processing protein PNO1 [Gracilariopsis chorda]
MSNTATIDISAVNEAAKSSIAMKTDTPTQLPTAPQFKKLSAKALRRAGKQTRKIPVPPNRMTPLKSNWMEIYEPIVKHLKLQIRMNIRTRNVELKTSKATEDAGALQKGADFVKAFVLGFSVADALALIRLDELYIESFEVKDIRATLKGDHLARAVGRIAGKDGRTKFTIENATKTRIVVADTKIHVLGSYENTRLARHAISSLVLGAAPGKVYNRLRSVSARLNERRF